MFQGNNWLTNKLIVNVSLTEKTSLLWLAESRQNTHTVSHKVAIFFSVTEEASGKRG